MIAIVDYGVGNLAAIQNMLNYLGKPSVITCDEKEIKNCDKLILPGVGRYDFGMAEIKKRNLMAALNEFALIEKRPVLGICLGMQLMLEYSEEGNCEGFGWIKGQVRKFPQDLKLCIPHMGWNSTKTISNNLLTANIDDNNRFYFVHSYYCCPVNENNVMFLTNYGIDFVSGVVEDNIYGVQFHPEKSHKYGMKLLKSFADL